MGEALSSGMRWSAISTVGREASRLIFTVLLARIIGPEPFGIVAQAMVYIAVVGLLLDQGFSSALIQRRRLEKDLPGAVVTVNLMIGAVLSLATLAVAPLWADFMSTPQLTLVLAVLAPGLLIRAVAITPRALLLREMAFRKIGIADVSSALVGGVLGVIVAELGGSYWALVVQTLSTDAVLAALLLLGAGRWPNLRLRVLRLIVGFSGRAFAAGLLINSVSRNIDSLLIGRYLGPEPLAFYGLANRLLLLPVRLVSTTIGGVLFPAFSRLAGDLGTLRTELARATRVIAVLACPSDGAGLCGSAAADPGPFRAGMVARGADRAGARIGRSVADRLPADHGTADTGPRSCPAQPPLRLADHLGVHGRNRRRAALWRIRRGGRLHDCHGACSYRSSG